MLKRTLKNRMVQAWLMLALLVGVSNSSYAQDWPCNCSKVVASCQATMELIPTKSPGTKLFGADLRFHADAPYCAKVEYYIDSTPHMTLLRDGKFGEDRILGTSKKAIRPEQAEIFSCKVCEGRDAARQEQDRQAQIQAQIDALVSESVQSGNLQPDYSRVAAPPPPDSTALMQSMQQIIQTQAASQRRSSSASRNTSSPSSEADVVCGPRGDRNTGCR